MRTVADILFAITGQSLVFDAPEGRPSSVVSVNVFRWNQSDDDDDEFTPTGTVEANPSTTLDGAAGPAQSDPGNIPLTVTAGCATGRTYLLTSAASLKEWVEVVSVTTDVSVTARHPLHNDYAIGATFASTRISAPVDATWVADETNIDDSAGPNPMFRVRWVYVVNAITYVADTYFNLVRYGARHGVLPQDIESSYASWLDQLPTDHRDDQGRKLIDEAYRAVKIDLHGIDLDDAKIAEAEIVDELVRYRTVERYEWSQFLSSRNADQTRHLAAKQAYGERMDQLVRLALKVPVRDAAGTATKKVGLGLTVR